MGRDSGRMAFHTWLWKLQLLLLPANMEPKRGTDSSDGKRAWALVRSRSGERRTPETSKTLLLLDCQPRPIVIGCDSVTYLGTTSSERRSTTARWRLMTSCCMAKTCWAIAWADSVSTSLPKLELRREPLEGDDREGRLLDGPLELQERTAFFLYAFWCCLSAMSQPDVCR